MIDTLEQLEDIENCVHLAIKAHEVETYNNALHYLKVIRKHIVSINLDLNVEDNPQEENGNVVSAKKPSLDEYDNWTKYNEEKEVHFSA